MAASTRTHASPFLAIFLIFAGAGLLWLVAVHSLAAYLADVAPEWALMLSPDNGDAILKIADVQLGSARSNAGETSGISAPIVSRRTEDRVRELVARGVPSPIVSPELSNEDRARLRRELGGALLANPQDSRALRMLGQIAENDDDARRLMTSAAKRSLHETLAVYWLMQDAFINANFRATANYADILLRSQLDLYKFIVPILARVAEAKDGAPPLKQILRVNPPWRWFFINYGAVTMRDPLKALGLLQDMRDNGTPPTALELKSFLSYLIGGKAYDLAYYSWLEFLPPEEINSQGFLFNGRFEFPLSGLPFDWEFQSGNGVRIEVVDLTDEPYQRAVSLDFIDGQVGASGVRQLAVLAAGEYVFSGSFSGAVRARRGLRWRIACVDASGALLAESDPFVGNMLAWRDFSFKFTVPASGCPAQQIRLELDAQSASERIVSGSARFTNLAILPAH